MAWDMPSSPSREWESWTTQLGLKGVTEARPCRRAAESEGGGSEWREQGCVQVSHWRLLGSTPG